MPETSPFLPECGAIDKYLPFGSVDANNRLFIGGFIGVVGAAPQADTGFSGLTRIEGKAQPEDAPGQLLNYASVGLNNCLETTDRQTWLD